MNHSPLRAAGPYRIHFTPEAWRKARFLPPEAFQALQGVLERLASDMGTPRIPGPIERGPRAAHTTMGEWILIYQRDDSTRVLSLVDLFGPLLKEGRPAGEGEASLPPSPSVRPSTGQADGG